MGELQAVSDSITPFQAIIWCFYPVGVLVGIELFLRAITNDDDDYDPEGGVMTPAFAPSAS